MGQKTQGLSRNKEISPNSQYKRATRTIDRRMFAPRLLVSVRAPTRGAPLVVTSGDATLRRACVPVRPGVVGRHTSGRRI